METYRVNMYFADKRYLSWDALSAQELIELESKVIAGVPFRDIEPGKNKALIVPSQITYVYSYLNKEEK